MDRQSLPAAVQEWLKEGIYASLDSSPRPVPESSEQLAMNQTQGLTLLPGSSQARRSTDLAFGHVSEGSLSPRKRVCLHLNSKAFGYDDLSNAVKGSIGGVLNEKDRDDERNDNSFPLTPSSLYNTSEPDDEATTKDLLLFGYDGTNDVIPQSSRLAQYSEHGEQQPTPATGLSGTEDNTDCRVAFQREDSVDSLFDDNDEPTQRVAASHTLLLPPLIQPPPQQQQVLPPQFEQNQSVTNQLGSCLQPQDLLAVESREVVRRTSQPPAYMTVYPEVTGPLGYLPSNPTLHVRYIKAIEAEVDTKIRKLRTENRSLRLEREKYRSSRHRWTEVDSVTGETLEEKLRAEIATLKRAVTQKMKMIANANEQTAYWRGKYRGVVAAAGPSNRSRYSFAVPPQVQFPNAIAAPPALPTHHQGYPIVPHVQAPAPYSPWSFQLQPVPSAGVIPPPNAVNHGGATTMQGQPNTAALNELQRKRYPWLENQGGASSSTQEPAGTGTGNEAPIESAPSGQAEGPEEDMEVDDEDELTRLLLDGLEHPEL